MKTVVRDESVVRMASRDMLHVAVPLHISLAGLGKMFAGFAIVILAVWVFLGRMLRISVRDVLAYE